MGDLHTLLYCRATVHTAALVGVKVEVTSIFNAALTKTAPSSLRETLRTAYQYNPVYATTNWYSLVIVRVLKMHYVMENTCF